jgi:transcriptional regulator with XRE-family HTH domain
MSARFSEKLSFVLKALSLSRGALASELNVDKSLVGRWVTGAVTPSRQNLSRLSELIARRVDGFNVLDWERPLAGLAALCGVDPEVVAAIEPVTPPDTLRLPLLDLVRPTTALRGRAYEGFFRSTRPYFQNPGAFIHDHLLIRLESNGLLGFRMVNNGVIVEGWILLLQSHCYVVSAELSSGTYAFGLFNGVSGAQVDRLDGLILIHSSDVGRTPYAGAMLLERIGELSGEEAADDARLAELGRLPAVAPKDSISPDIAAHLVRDIGPSQIACGGDWLLSLPRSDPCPATDRQPEKDRRGLIQVNEIASPSSCQAETS